MRTVTILAAVALSAGSLAPVPTAHAAGPEAGFHPITPARVLDTRAGAAQGFVPVAKRALAAGEVLRVPLWDAGPLPENGFAAVALNVTVTNPQADGFVTQFPCVADPYEDPAHDVSSVNFRAGATVANQVLASLGYDGHTCFESSVATDLIVDVSGWFGDSAYSPLQPVRVFDTRAEGGGGIADVDVPVGPVGGVHEVRVRLTDLTDRTPGNATAVAVNLTSTRSMATGYVTAYPCGARPEASSLNFTAGIDVANAAILPLSDAGEACFYSSEPTDLLLDLDGYFVEEDGGFVDVEPARLVDTRPGAADGLRPVAKQRIGADVELQVSPVGIAGVPASGVAAVSLNVTAVDPIGDGYLTVYPCGVRPEASNLNYGPGRNVANAVIAPLSADGAVCVYASAGTHLLVDVNGWFRA